MKSLTAAALAKASIRQNTIVKNGTDSQMELKEATVNATRADIRINVAVLLAATSLSTPTFSHTGIKIRAPPIANVAPTNPAKNPATKKCQTLCSFTTSLVWLTFLPLLVIISTFSLIKFSFFILSLILFPIYTAIYKEMPRCMNRNSQPTKPQGLIPIIESYFQPPRSRDTITVKMQQLTASFIVRFS